MQRVDKWLGDRAQTIYSHYIVISLYNVQSLSEIKKRNVTGEENVLLNFQSFGTLRIFSVGEFFT